MPMVYTVPGVNEYTPFEKQHFEKQHFETYFNNYTSYFQLVHIQLSLQQKSKVDFIS